MELGKKIAEFMHARSVLVTFKKFPDGESYIRIEEELKSDDVCIVQTTYPSQDESIMQLALIADAARNHGAKTITAVVPYLAYARQDKIFLEGEAVSIDAVAKMLNSVGIDKLLTVNIHKEDVLSRFQFKAKSISAAFLLAEYFNKKGLSGAFALAPDENATYMAESASAVLNGGFGYFEKIRDPHTEAISMVLKKINVKGRTVIIFDDMISTGSTIVAAAKNLKKLGAAKICVGCVHPLLAGDAEERIRKAGVSELVGTDSISSNVSKVSLSPLIGKELLSSGIK